MGDTAFSFSAERKVHKSSIDVLISRIRVAECFGKYGGRSPGGDRIDEDRDSK